MQDEHGLIGKRCSRPLTRTWRERGCSMPAGIVALPAPARGHGGHRLGPRIRPGLAGHRARPPTRRRQAAHLLGGPDGSRRLGRLRRRLQPRGALRAQGPRGPCGRCLCRPEARRVVLRRHGRARRQPDHVGVARGERGRVGPTTARQTRPRRGRLRQRRVFRLGRQPKTGFRPVAAHRHGHDHRPDLLAWLDYYTLDKVLLHFTRPPS